MGADGGHVGSTSGAEATFRSRFDRAVEPGGYAWWYIDALSDDGRHGLTIIAFVGSVFSPYYAWARRRGAADPENFCALNVALYGTSGKRWCLTERGSRAVARDAERLTVGPSAVSWNGRWLQVDIDEVTAPLPQRLRGRVRLHPPALTEHSYALEPAGRHRWWPAAPCSRVEVDMERPGLRWRGAGYFDANWGSEPLERGFVRWDWSRAALADGACAVLYDTLGRSAPGSSLALHCDRSGRVSEFPPPPRTSLPRTRVWRIKRGTQVEHGHAATVAKTLEDTPFYARSLVSSHLLGEAVTAMHESLSLERFSRAWVQVLLPFRMPRMNRG